MKKTDSGIVLLNDEIEISDREQHHEDSYQHNRVTIIDLATGKTIFKRKPNKVLISGSTYNARRIIPGIKPRVTFPTYNTDLGLENSVKEEYLGENFRQGEFVYLMCVGKNGCGPDGSQEKKVRYASRIEPEDLVPFKYVPISNDISTEQRNLYFGRCVEDSIVKYYFKTWSAEPEYVQQFMDGTPIDENVWSSERAAKEATESVVKLYFNITTDDCRDYFMYTTSIADAKLSQISLCSAWKKEINGFTYFQDITPYSLLNFPTELLIDKGKSFEIIYELLP